MTVIPKSPWKIDATLWPAVALLILLFLGLEYSGIDLWVQDHFFNAATQQWLVDGSAAGPRFWFYNGPKGLVILLGVGILVLALLPSKWRQKLPGKQLSRRALWVAFLCIGLVPAAIGQLKAVTNIFCPSEIRRYGGDVPYVKVVECYPENDRPERRGRCFPAGHASGGFALFALMGFAATRRGQRLGLAIALGMGWTMGLYQMLKGSHYLSHTVITMLLAWIGFLLLRRAFRLHRATI
jgi:membrane-associated PAP2 superfamily phosphatase